MGSSWSFPVTAIGWLFVLLLLDPGEHLAEPLIVDDRSVGDPLELVEDYAHIFGGPNQTEPKMKFIAGSLSWMMLYLGISAAVLLFLLQSYSWAMLALVVGLLGAYLHFWRSGS